MPDDVLPIDPSARREPPVETASLLKLVVWMSPAFPIGAFAYSHGLEWAAETGHVKSRDSLQAWLADLLALGSIPNDMMLLAAAWRATAARDAENLRQAAELALALQPGAERHLETVTQGNAFAKTVKEAWPCDAALWLDEAWPDDVALPVAVGVSAAGHGIALDAVLPAYGTAFVTNLVSAAIRLSVVGQTDGQRIIADLLPVIRAASDKAAASTLDDIGSATWSADLASLHHETQYTRLFRS